jgi:hypothetical protein
MARLAIAFKEEISEERVALYYEFFGVEDFEKLRIAIDQIILDNKWFPKISEIHEYIHPSDSAHEDWYQYLERETEQFQSLMIEHKENRITKEEAKGLIADLKQRWQDEEEKKEELRAQEFETKRAILKKQAKLLS